ncbi:hypothetical protein A4X09_0g5691 [Tilletia walkeri]|uniref:Autophagy-related protein 2 n=1 Tax=Tilletia walkeri TaxID=117179 RepID=A0A8X7N6X2_9BASI|nr:hypothetical protein A4X09_0g5691 [Tilletia walkeri]
MWSWLAEAVTLPLGVGTTAGIASLSTALQRRILASLLRRFLGHLLVDPEKHFDEASLDAALLVMGRVEVRNLTLDPAAINALLLASQQQPQPAQQRTQTSEPASRSEEEDKSPPTVPIRIVRGSISRIAIQLPWPNIWSGDLSVEVEGPDVALVLHRSPDSSSAESEARRQEDEDAAMAGSVMFHSFIEGIENEPEIAAALHKAESSASMSSSSSSSSSQRPPPAFARPAPKKAAPPATSTTSSMHQGVVDSLLARLKISVTRARITVLPSQSASRAAPNRVPSCQLCFDSLAFNVAPQTDEDASSETTAETASRHRTPQEVVRSASLQGLSLWILSEQEAFFTPQSSTSDLTGSIASESSSDSGGARTNRDGAQRFVFLPAVELTLRQIPAIPSLSRPKQGSSSAVIQTEVKIPSLRLSLNRSVLVGLQLLADDYTQWANSLPTPNKEVDEEEEQEGLSSSSSQCTELDSSLVFDMANAARDDDIPAMDMTQSLVGLPAPPSASGFMRGPPQFRLGANKRRPEVSKTTVQIEEVILDARISRRMDEHRSRHFRLAAGQTEIVVQPRPEDKRMSIDVRVGGLDMEEVAESGHSWQILQRTPPKSLFAPRNPIFKLHLVSFADPETNYRESKMAIVLDDFIVSLRADPTVLEDLIAFVAAPEGAFEQVEPNEVTRVSIRIPSGSISVVPSGFGASRSEGGGEDSPLSQPHGRLVLTLADLHARLKMMPRSENTPIHLSWKEACLYVLDQVQAGQEGGGRVGRGQGSSRARGIADGLDGFWKAQGFAPILNVRNFISDTTLHKSTKPAVELSVSRGNINVMLCADTVSAAAALGQAISADLTAHASANKADVSGNNMTESQTTTSRDSELLMSVDDHAFDQAPTLSSIPDLLEDDIPHDPSYVGTQTESPRLREIDLSGSDFFGEGAIEAVPVEPEYDGTVVSVADGVTIRMLHPDGIQPELDYFVRPVPKDNHGASRYTSNMRLRCSRLNVTLGLFAGYDWAVTRRALEEEARRVRRRLQKIKQLLSEGQQPDDSVEQAMESLSESVHLTLPDGEDELNATNALETLREEFGDDLESEAVDRDDAAETESTTSTWQAMPTAKSRSRMPQGGSSTKRTKLERSVQSMIDINLKGISADFDAYDDDEPLTSRLSVSAKKLEIIDNIKTSTWKTFLTELLPEGRTTHRDANAKMLRVLLENERTDARELGYEAKLRLKIAPLRLHVDQDALDFLKAFFAFKLPGTPSGPTGPAPPSDPHIQVGDVHAVRIKLDYKPKRVDYGQLRQGKTIELMNFFHFDGSDMTLRHVTLRGIAGWPRFFEALNDIWTPDVKANQLADVLAGVAPIRTVVNVGAGVADLVLLPIEQYQKDGRLVKGIGRGLGSFAKTTALEAVKLSAQLATGTQVILERAEHVLGGRMSADVRAEPVGSAALRQGGSGGIGGAGIVSGAGPSSHYSRGGTSSSGTTRPIARPRISDERIDPVGRGLGEDGADGSDTAPLSKYARPPEDMRDAIQQAYAGLRRGVNSAAQTILAVPMEVYESPGGQGSAQPIIRAVPIAFLQGALGASEAVSKTLLGLQNAMDPTKDSEGKYK